MMNIIVYIATSIDGYIADKNGQLDWLTNIENPTESDFGFFEFMENIDAIVMGRVTFETVLSFGIDWPYEKPVYVLSHTLSELPHDLPENVKLLAGTAKEIIHRLEADGYHNIYLDGGSTVQEFFAQNLVDELIITRAPIILGEGKSLFKTLPQSIHFKHIKTHVYIDSLVKTHYRKC